MNVFSQKIMTFQTMRIVPAYRIPSPIGELLLAEHEGALIRCDFAWTRTLDEVPSVFVKAGLSFEEHPMAQAPEVVRRAACELNEYFRGERRIFEVPLKFMGTDFEVGVRKVLLTIPFGSLMSYGDVAAALGKPAAARAVGRAVGANPLAVFVPCHRVVGSNGALTGFAGGLDAKRALLRLEGHDV